MIKVGIVGDNAIHRKGISGCIGEYNEIEVLIESDGGVDLLTQLEDVALDVVIWTFDKTLDFEKYLEIILKQFKIRVLLVDALFDRKLYLKVMKTKRFGYFSMRTPDQELKRAIQRVMDKGFYFDKKLPEQWREESGIECAPACFLNLFTERQLEVAKQAIIGKKSLDIGEDLFISLSTVETHRSNIMMVTGLKNFMEVSWFLIQYGFLCARDVGIRLFLVGLVLTMSLSTNDNWVVDDDDLGTASYEYVMPMEG